MNDNGTWNVGDWGDTVLLSNVANAAIIRWVPGPYNVTGAYSLNPKLSLLPLLPCSSAEPGQECQQRRRGLSFAWPAGTGFSVRHCHIISHGDEVPPELRCCLLKACQLAVRLGLGTARPCTKLMRPLAVQGCMMKTSLVLNT